MYSSANEAKSWIDVCRVLTRKCLRLRVLATLFSLPDWWQMEKVNYCRSYPGCVSTRNLYLAVQIFQRIMICVQDELAMKNIVSPMLNCLDNGIELQVIGVVAASSSFQLLTIKYTGFDYWLNTALISSFDASQWSSKGCVKSGSTKISAVVSFSLIKTNASSACLDQVNVNLHTVCYTGHDCAEVLNKPPVEGRETMKALKFGYCLRGWPEMKWIYLTHIHKKILRTKWYNSER